MSHGGHSDEGDVNVAKIRATRIRIIRVAGDKKVWLVSGSELRKHYVDFTEGGNSQRYRWIPHDEIWIDNANYKEWKFILIHELTEWNGMKHDGLAYDPAHLKANVQEVRARNNPELTDGILAKEIARLIPGKSSRYGG